MRLKVISAIVLGLGLAACTPAPPGQPVSGITSSNGGGQRSLHDIPNVGITTVTPSTY